MSEASQHSHRNLHKRREAENRFRLIGKRDGSRACIRNAVFVASAMPADVVTTLCKLKKAHISCTPHHANSL
jgi:hypothetical protein